MTDTIPRGLAALPTTDGLVRYRGSRSDLSGCLGWIEGSELVDEEPRFSVALVVDGNVRRISGISADALRNVPRTQRHAAA